MKISTTALAIAALMLGTAAHAQQAKSPMYGEIGYTVLNVEAGGGFEANPTAVRGIVGYDLHPMFAVEGMLAVGANSDEGTDNTPPPPRTIRVKLKHSLGVFVKPKFNPTANLEVFGRLGFAQTKGESSRNGTQSDGRVAYGVGLNYSFNPKMYVGADYMLYGKKNDGKVDGLTVSLGLRF